VGERALLSEATRTQSKTLDGNRRPARPPRHHPPKKQEMVISQLSIKSQGSDPTSLSDVMSTDQDDKWPVEVFRYSHGRGWELFQQAASSDDGQKVTATPRRGCVEVRKLRLRIHVLQSALPTSAPKEMLSNFSETKTERRKYIHTTSMVRRRDTILLSKGDFGAVVLKFESITACVAFVDHMVELNQGFVFNQNEEKNAQRMDSENDIIVEKNNDASNSNADAVRETNNAIQSHLIALLHDDDFLGFVDRVENSLSSDDDCMKMLQALAYPRANRDWPA
jgi:hypothetical protein